MAISKDKKKAILDELKGIVKEAGSLVFVNFHGLGMNETTNVRKELKTKGIGYMVAKKTLTKKAFSESGVTGEMPVLEGELGIVYGKDLIEPAQKAYEFEKKLDKKIAILGGVFEGKFMNKSEMTVIAEIPPLKTLHAQLVNLINSPIQGFVMALSEIAKSKQ